MLDRRKYLVGLLKVLLELLCAILLNLLNLIIRVAVLLWTVKLISVLQFFNDKDCLEHSEVTVVYAVLRELTFCILGVKLRYLLNFFVEELSKKLLKFEAKLVWLLVEISLHLFVYEGYFTVDESFYL